MTEHDLPQHNPGQCARCRAERRHHQQAKARIRARQMRARLTKKETPS